MGDQPHATTSPVSRLILSLTAALLVLLGLAMSQTLMPARPWHVAAAPAADCVSGNVPSLIESDTTLSGALFVTADVTVRAGATLTLTAGTDVTMCGPYELIFNDGALHAEGTAADPIIIAGETPATRWERIFFNGFGSSLRPSLLRYVILDGGGGSDPSLDLGALHVEAANGTTGVGPVVDQVTIRDSGAYGVYVRVNHTDGTPPLFSGLTITNSARAPMVFWASAVGGLGSGNAFGGNGEDVIEVRVTSLGGSLDYDATWYAQPVPYRLLGLLNVADARSPVLTISPGTSIEMADTGGFWINSAGLVINGTPTEPITITRAPGVTTWDRLYYERNINPASSLGFVTVEHAGGINGAIDFRGDALTLDHVTVRHATNAGLYTQGSFVQVKDSLFEQNGEGLRFQYGAGGVLRRNVIQDNGVGITVLTNTGDVCVDALGNYWGAGNGPSDADAALDVCNLATTNAGSGDSVTGDMLYRPWLSSPPGGGAIDTSQITAADFWVIADGVQTTTLTIRARDAQGAPLAGKEIALETTHGILQQPATPTDANGVTTAVIRATESGRALVTAFNVTDGLPLGALASITFWQGQGNIGGLIPPGGSPYASPRLVIEGRPFETGLPMTFRLPMQNTNAVPVDVQVVYSVSALNIGAEFTPVYTTSVTLQPGESWDAPATWVPPVTGHHCVSAEVTVTLPDGQQFVMSPDVVVIGSGRFRINLNFMPPDPCADLDATKLVPDYGGLNEVRKHIRTAMVQLYLSAKCVEQKVSFGPSSSLALQGSAALTAARDYQTVAPPPALTMPQLAAGGAVSQAEADAANAVGDTVAGLVALDIAIETARDRAAQAGEADDAVWVSRQTTAYREYQRLKGAALKQLATHLEALLAVTQGAGQPDDVLTPADYEAYLAELLANGYDAETIAFHKAFGRTDAAIARQLQDEIASLTNGTFFVTSFYGIVAEARDAAAAEGARLQSRYGLPSAQSGTVSAQAGDAGGLYLGTLTSQFLVGNPTESQQTIDLIVHPVELPLDWTYALSPSAPVLGPGEAVTVTLTINAGAIRPQDSQARLAVEGYIGSELIGGILFQQSIPSAGPNTIYLPLVIRN